ncbi:arylsulfatase B-like isoform X3 [Haliotis rufescens]|uniref:arylsulfatase B-like isoform X3 n=1 Tax=Haliotis rufescens TaxID=6454 RepID=UPI00201E811C|nr:arylsulfatase B-like isoform X3 [Haliotis rufescens]
MKLALITVLLLVCVTSEAKRPNIIFIVADDLGWGDVGFHGSKIRTPYLDKLAYNGILLNNYYVSPICTPTRSALMTGRHPIHTGLQHGVIGESTPYGLSLNETIMPQYLNELGYASHIVGKWHLGFFTKNHVPTMRGFDSHFGYYTGKEDYFDHTSKGPGMWGLDFRRNLDLVRTDDEQYSTTLFATEASDVIRAHNQSKPLFLYLAFQAVHAGNPGGDSIQAPQKYVDRFPDFKDTQRKLFAGVVSALDEAVANVTATLQQTGMLNNSIIVFTTDNGGPTNGYDNNAACNWPLRGCKNTMWEGGVRGNGFIYSPLLSTSGYVQDNMMHITDWLPTLYHAAGGDVNKLRNQDGYNLWEMLSNDGEAVRQEILHNIDPIQNFSSIRVGDYKLVMGDISGGRDDSWYPPPEGEDTNFEHPSGSEFVNIFSKNDHPVDVKCGKKPVDAETNCQPEVSPCLFHIPSDPCEFHNIASTNPDKVQALLARLDVYRKTMVTPANKPSDPNSDPRLHGGAWTWWL